MRAEFFEPILKFEELPTKIVQHIYQHGRFIISGKIDQEFGCGQISPDTKAVWTEDGKRISVTLLRTVGGGLIISQSRDVDPLYAERKARK